MRQEEAVRFLEKQIDALSDLTDGNIDGWRHRTEGLLERVFGQNSRQLQTLRSTKVRQLSWSKQREANSGRLRDRRGIVNTEILRSVLVACIQDIHDYGLSAIEDGPGGEETPLEVLERICNRFHLVAQQLRSRHERRQTLEINDEYDVQDLLHALLKLHFDDIRPEEWAPSYAAKSSRMDFLLKSEQIAIEVKKTRDGLGGKEVADQLIIDKERYQKTHPDCKILFCFVYDPDDRISNPTGIENDLSERCEGFSVRVIVRPRR